MMRNILFTMAAIAPLALADTYITYDDGSQYTLGEEESVYVSDRPLFDRRSPLNGDVNFVKQRPFAERDYEEPVVFTPSGQIGSHEWCLDFEPWANGLTFDQISWNYACDTNGNYVYGCGDSKFEESEGADVCGP
jgi:hypothetical protein